MSQQNDWLERASYFLIDGPPGSSVDRVAEYLIRLQSLPNNKVHGFLFNGVRVMYHDGCTVDQLVDKYLEKFEGSK